MLRLLSFIRVALRFKQSKSLELLCVGSFSVCSILLFEFSFTQDGSALDGSSIQGMNLLALETFYCAEAIFECDEAYPVMCFQINSLDFTKLRKILFYGGTLSFVVHVHQKYFPLVFFRRLSVREFLTLVN